jgi:adenylate cyclase
MPREIERKFLLRNDDWRPLVKSSRRISQGYLPSGEGVSMRVRIEGEMANLNIKSATLAIERLEYEYPIPLAEAVELLEQLCRRPFIDKVRHEVDWYGHCWEIDCFGGENSGLVVAEIELAAVDEPFERPPWDWRRGFA